jgi:translation elongation factor EF-1beta
LDDSEEKKAAPQEKKGASRKSSEADKPASKAPSRKQSEADKKDSKPSSKAPSRKSSDADKKDSKKDKKNKKGKKQEEEEPAPIEEEPAVEEAAEEAPAEEEPVEEEENMSLDDLVADDDEDDEETKAMFSKQKGLIEDIQKRQAANAGKAKSNLTLDVKPYDTETDMGALEQKIRGIEMEGLKWLGASLIDVAYGIKKLRIMCQLVDVLVNPDSVREEIEKFEEEVQSTDIFAFQMA